MKKFILALIALVTMYSCACNREQNEEPTIATVEDIIAVDRENMRLTYGEDYRWYETSIVLNKYVDAEDTDMSIQSLTNVFQVLTMVTDHSGDIKVVTYFHEGDSTTVNVVEDLWVGDEPLNDQPIVVTFEDAYSRLIQANIVKPHSRMVVLRKEVAPLDANPQWIFGNVDWQVYIDAITGDVRRNNPAFPDEK